MSKQERKAEALAYLSGSLEELLQDNDELSSEEIKETFNKTLDVHDINSSILKIE